MHVNFNSSNVYKNSGYPAMSAASTPITPEIQSQTIRGELASKEYAYATRAYALPNIIQKAKPEDVRYTPDGTTAVSIGKITSDGGFIGETYEYRPDKSLEAIRYWDKSNKNAFMKRFEKDGTIKIYNEIAPHGEGFIKYKFDEQGNVTWMDY